jgi:hypothetical protein
MRTITIILGGFVLLGLFVFVGRWVGASATSLGTAAKIFIPIWLIAAGLNMWMGTRAGYSVAEELPIFLLIFAAPAAVALFVWWKFS